MFKKVQKYLAQILILSVVMLSVLIGPQSQVRSSGSAITGWAWSSNIGWVNLTGTGHNDGLVMGSADSSGNYPITGYAWNDNIGWIQFGTVTGPAAPSAVRIYLTDTTQTTWSVPTDWNNSNNTIEVIGGGGAGTPGFSNLGGGGGGAYAKKTNVTLTPGGTVSFAVGAGGGNGGDGTDTYFCNSQSSCTSLSDSAVVVGAQHGSAGNGGTGGAGGSAGASVGSTKYSGGNGGSGSGSTTGGGGGAAGPNGNGGNGGNGGVNLGGNTGGVGGGGGGGNGGGSNGANGTADTGNNFAGGNGGNNSSASGGGSGATSVAAGSAGTSGGGGGGGAILDSNYNINSGGNGGNGTDLYGTYGSGGGGGGSVTGGGTGGLYGGGGGGGDASVWSPSSGAGAQGIIVITYTPAVPINAGVAKIIPNSSGVGAKIDGWAKALAATGSGWDGWIYLGDAGNNSGLSVDDSGSITGYAWGNDVIGWLRFNSVLNNTAVITPPCTANSICTNSTTVSTTHPWCQVTTTTCTGNKQCSAGACITVSPTGSVSVTPNVSRVRKGNQVQLSWTVSHAQNCQLTGKNSSGGILGPYSSSPTPKITINYQTAFTLTCNGVDDLGGNTYTVGQTTIGLIPGVQEI
jgi:hypothetical protein